MHALVTGAGGFSGSAVVKALLLRGHKVTAAFGPSAKGAVVEVRAREGMDVLVGDLAGEMALPQRLDAIVHTAARSPGPGTTDEQFVRSNVDATRRLVEHARRSGVRRFVYLSSLSIYGRIESAIVDENSPILDPDAYGRTKRQGEELLADEASRFASIAIRLPGVIGKGSVRNWLTSVLHAAREGRDITIFNPDAPFNNAVHVAELAEFTGRLLDAQWQGFDAIAIGAAGQTTVRRAVELVVDAFGGRSRVRSSPQRKASFLISNERACGRYGYQPSDITAMLKRFSEENRDAG